MTKHLKAYLDLTATIVMIIAAGVITWRAIRPTTTAVTRREIPVPVEPLVIDGSPTIGQVSAPVILLEFSDFQCPYCARFARDTWPALKSEYVDVGRVRLAFRHLPLVKLHAQAWRAAEAAECAARQGKFSDMHDALFASSPDLSEAALSRHAIDIALDTAIFARCMEGGAANRVKEDAELAVRLKFSATPIFLIGRLQADGRMKAVKLLRGAAPLKEFRALLDGVVKEPSQ